MKDFGLGLIALVLFGLVWYGIDTCNDRIEINRAGYGLTDYWIEDSGPDPAIRLTIDSKEERDLNITVEVLNGSESVAYGRKYAHLNAGTTTVMVPLTIPHSSPLYMRDGVVAAYGTHYTNIIITVGERTYKH